MARREITRGPARAGSGARLWIRRIAAEIAGLRSRPPWGIHWRWKGFWAKAYTRFVARDFAAFGAGSLIWLPIDLWHPEAMSVGEEVTIGPSCRLRAGRHAEVRIGDRTILVGNVTIQSDLRIVIGESVLISRNVSICDYEHERSDASVPVMDQGLRKQSRVEIADGAWLGAGAVVHTGVRIGRNAVVGSNAVVRSDVPDHEVAVGVPARLLGSTQASRVRAMDDRMESESIEDSDG